MNVAAKQPPDVVITDLAFGGLRRDGVWLLEQLRNRRDLAQAAVIAITGHDLDASWRHQYDFDAVLLKPVDMEQVSTLVASLARRRGPPRRP